MNVRLWSVLTFVLSAAAGRAAPPEERPELAPCFADEKVIGTFVLHDVQTGAVRVHNPVTFALNLEISTDADAPKRLTIGRACLKALGALK